MNPLELGGRKKSSAETIFEMLVEDWPLSVKEIYNRARRRYSLDITYQGIHKKVKELEKEGVLQKKDQKYELNLEWISKERDLFQNVEAVYRKDKLASIQPTENKIVSFNLRTPPELVEFMLTFSDDFPNPENKPMVFQWWSLYPCFAISEKDYSKMKNAIVTNNLHILGHTTTPIDKSLLETYTKLGAKVKLGANVPFNPDVMVKGDYVCNLYFKDNFRLDWVKYCQSRGLIKKIKLIKLLTHLHETKTIFQITISKNAEVAEIIREQALKQFKN